MSLKVYYLDDEPDLCELFLETVSSPDIVVETFQDPSVLMSKCRDSKPDIVFLDYRLPSTTGDEVAQKLDPGITKILITGDLQVNTKYHFSAFLEKPAKAPDIIDLIHRLNVTKLI